jgi:uncharacterized Zn finger protein (UPF0148 family)
MAQTNYFCPECGSPFDAALVEKLKTGKQIFCTSCGKGFSIQIPTDPQKKEEGLAAGLKRFGKKLEKDLKKVGESIENKFQDKKTAPSSAPAQPAYQAPPPASQSNYSQPVYSSPPPSRAPPPQPKHRFMGGLQRMYNRMQPLSPEELEERRLLQQARQNVMHGQFFRMHLLTFILINIMITVINLLVDPSYWFFLWVVTGWGLLMCIHTYRYIDSRGKRPAGFFTNNFALFLLICSYLFFVDTFDGRRFTDPIDFALNVTMIWGAFLLILFVFNYYWGLESVKQEMRSGDKPDLLKKPVIVTNLLAYVIFNLLAFVSDILIPMNVRWYYWTIIAWGIVILIQVLLSAIYHLLNLTPAGILLFVHTLAYLSLSTLIILMDAFSGQGFTDAIGWSLIPVAFWGVLYILHFIVYLVWFRNPTSEQIDKEMERLKAQRNQP